ncbi:2OG-Fe dioxygenase family protein [Streptomyces sp. NPDC006997]|uniref:2OG-Fe dioxygenase family protein n=1 Tax=Streptomyces sp. NPDC006997 TaxID=3155356 RepID=UPI00340566B0
MVNAEQSTELPERARRALASSAVCLLTAAEVSAYVGTDAAGWADFARHWEELAPDPYAAERGTRRARRYGRFRLADGTGDLTPLPHRPFAQPQASNPLYVTVDRHFAPLTGAFAVDPVLRGLLRLLGGAAAGLADTGAWEAQVHPFRVLAEAGGGGEPTPEGLHHDGVTLVSALLVDRHNATGGRTCVVGTDGEPLLETTLSEPGTLLLGDDRRTVHGVSPVRPLDEGAPAWRDVLVATLIPAGRD